ncbi:MAG: DUF4163 domain-containing protein [Clostridia bacterium]|nr:DUF4163 domain-containing protein [Clostridia bacterium]
MSALKNKTAKKNRILYVILLLLVLGVLCAFIFLLPDRQNNTENDTKTEETEAPDTEKYVKIEAEKTKNTESKESVAAETEAPASISVPVGVTGEVIKESHVRENGAQVSLKITKPVFSEEQYGENAMRLNDLIELKTDEVTNEYLKRTDSSVTDTANEEYAYAYEIIYNDKGIVSLLYHIYIDNGVKRTLSYGSVNYDMNKANTFTLSELFGEEVEDIHSKIVEQVSAMISEQPDNYTVTDKEVIRVLYERSKQQFVTDSESITVYFQPGELCENKPMELTSFNIPLNSLN